MPKIWIQSLGWEDPPGEGKGYPLQYSGLDYIQYSGLYSPRGHKESDTTEHLSLTHALSA